MNAQTILIDRVIRFAKNRIIQVNVKQLKLLPIQLEWRIGSRAVGSDSDRYLFMRL